MMKKTLKIFFFLTVFFLCILNVNAAGKKLRVDYNDVNLRSGPGTNYSSIKKLGVSSTFNLVSEELFPNEKGCDDGWYKIYYSGENTGYVCSSFVTIIVTEEEVPSVASSDCEKELESLGFPSSYWPSLCSLKEKHSNWIFEADKTGLPFATAIEKESVVGKSLIQSSNQGYFSTESSSYDYLTDTFTVKEGKDWYAANSDVVAYYLDPRNFLDERFIFMFEKLSFDANYQTVDAINAVLSGRDISEKSSVIYSAGSSNNINAIFLASKIKQETGGNYSNYSLSGTSITYNNTNYSPVYNPYNIGANTGAYDGLVWAVSGTSYLRPWTSLDNAINGGASYISSKYISKGQDTIYFQKFNTSSYSSYAAYAHQYMTNIKAAASEASITYNGYKDMNLLENVSYKFVIPVYDNMGAISLLPDGGNPNNHLKNIKINNTDLSGFSHDKYSYNYYVNSAVSKINITAETINSKASVSGTGEIEINENKKTISIKVTAENKKEQIYEINVIKTEGADISVADIIINSNLPVSDNYFILNAGYDVSSLNSSINKVASTATINISGKTDGTLATGDEVTIVNGNDLQKYVVVIKGDSSGDGNINIQDLLKIQKHILGYSSLVGSYEKASDLNSDGVINIQDLLRVQKHILGYITIS